MSKALIAAIVVIGIVGYGAGGYVYTTNSVASAQRTLDAVVSHQNQLNTTFHDIDSQFNALNSSSTFNPTQARTVIDNFVSNAQAAAKTVEDDDASLATASNSLGSRSWLTMMNRGSVDKESTRIGHARRALANARTVASDYVLDGQFLKAFMDTIIDLDTLTTQSAAGDLIAEKNTLGSMKAHVDRATQLSTSPGLPADLHSLMVDFQTLVSDYGKLVDSALANDDAGVTSSSQSVRNDANKISGYDFNKISADIDNYYKPLVDGFNAEMAAATS